MLSPEEKKILKFLKKYLLTHGVYSAEFEFEYDGGDLGEISPNEFDVVGWGQDATRIPAKISEVLYQIFMREVEPKLEEAYNDVHNDISSSGVRLRFDFRFDTTEISSYFWWSFYGVNEETHETYEYDDYQPQIENCIRDLKELNSNINEARVDYSGGGDSGYVEDTITTNEGDFLTPESCSDFIYENLPSGWEINEGSQGFARFVFPENIEDSYIEIMYQENYEGEGTTTLFEEEF